MHSVDLLRIMCYYVLIKGNELMNTKNISIRIKENLIAELDKIAKKHEWSRNYVISKFLTEKVYKLSGDSA